MALLCTYILRVAVRYVAVFLEDCKLDGNGFNTEMLLVRLLGELGNVRGLTVFG